MTPDSAQAFGVALMAMWGTAGAVALGRSVAKSPAVRELAAAVRKMSLAAKGALAARILPRRFAEVRRFAPDVREPAGEYWDAEPKASFKQHSERYSLHA